MVHIYGIQYPSLLMIYKSLIRRSHLDYGAMVYNQPNNKSLFAKIESLQCNAALAITGAIKDSSKEKCIKSYVLNLQKIDDR